MAEKTKKTSDAQLKAVKKYDQDSINFAVSYKRLERADGLRLQTYLNITGQKANSYLKALIKADLDSKGFYVDDTTIDSADTPDSDSANN